MLQDQTGSPPEQHAIVDRSAPQARTLNPRSKQAAVLRVFLERGSDGLNCFEAVRLAHDYVLRSSVSALKRHYGVEFIRIFEQIPGYGGSATDCVRYSLSPDGAARARELLGSASVERSVIDGGRS